MNRRVKRGLEGRETDQGFLRNKGALTPGFFKFSAIRFDGTAGDYILNNIPNIRESLAFRLMVIHDVFKMYSGR